MAEAHELLKNGQKKLIFDISVSSFTVAGRAHRRAVLHAAVTDEIGTVITLHRLDWRLIAATALNCFVEMLWNIEVFHIGIFIFWDIESLFLCWLLSFINV